MRQKKNNQAKSIEYECIVVDRKHYATLRQVGEKYHGRQLSLNAVFQALRYESNSPTAKEIRRIALNAGGQIVTKTRVLFL